MVVSGGRMRPASDGLTIVYDGECPFCVRQIERIRGWDRAGRFAYVPRQSEGLAERFPQLACEDFSSGLRAVRADGSVAVGAEAVYEIARRLPRWRWVAWVYRVPVVRGVCDRAYGWVAARRERSRAVCPPQGCASGAEGESSEGRGRPEE